MQVEYTTEIQRPVEVVFDYLSHHANHVHFIEQNISCEQLTPGPMGVGTQVRNTARLFGPLGGRIQEHFDIVAFERPKLIKKTSRPGSTFNTGDSFALSDASGHTRITLTIWVEETKPLKKAFARLMRPVLQRASEKALVKLKAILEATPSA